MRPAVKVIKQLESGWVFEVELAGSQFVVELERAYYLHLTAGKVEPGLLVRRSFDFLLVREPKEQILPKFNLAVIQEYFPEYEHEVGMA
jgi:hypothetical protein